MKNLLKESKDKVAGTWFKLTTVAIYTIISLLVIEYIVVHFLAFLYVRNFKVQLVPTTKVLSPIK